MRLIVLLAIAACGKKAGESKPPPSEPGSAAVESAPIAEPKNVAPDLPLPEGASKRLGGSRFRHAGRVTAVAVSPDGKLLATGAGDNTLRVWNAATGELAYAPELKTFMDRVEDVLFVDGHVVFASGSNPITVVSTTDWSERQLTTCGKHWTRGIAASPDGTQLAITCEYDNEVRLQPFAGGEHIAIRGVIKPDLVAWSADGKWIAVRSLDDDQVHLIDVAKKQIVKRVPGLRSYPHVLAFAPSGAVLAYDDHDDYTEEKVVLYDVNTDNQIGAYDTHVGAESVAFSSDGKVLAYAMKTGSRSLVAIDLATGKRTELLRPTRTVNAMAFQPGSQTRLWIAHDNGVRQFDLAADAEAFGPAGHIGEVTALAYAPDGKTLASGSTDGTVRLWNVGAGTSRKLQVLSDEYGVIFVDGDDDYKKFSVSHITGLDWSRDGTTLYETDGFIGTGIFRQWNPATGALTRAKGLQRYGIRALAMSPDDAVTITLGSDEEGNTIRWVDTASGKTLRTLEDVGDEDLAVSPDGKKLAVTTPDGVRILDAATGAQLLTLPDALAYALAFSADSKLLAVGGSSDAAVWDATTGKQVASIYAETYVKSVAFAPDGRLICGTYRGGVIIAKLGANLDAPADQIERTGHKGIVQAIAVAPDGKSFATGAVDGSILIWPL